MESKKKYWKGLEQLHNTPEFKQEANKEFNEYLPLPGEKKDDPSRRDFLKVMGFSVGAASLAACQAPVKYAIPYVVKPEDVDPSIPNYYATTYVSGSDASSVVVKTKEGRPIKVEGNEFFKAGSGTSSEMEASVLSLYDQERLRQPLVNGKKASWGDIDFAVKQVERSKIAIVSNTVSSPSTKKAIDLFSRKFAEFVHIQYDQISCNAILEAHLRVFGKRVYPSYSIDKAKTIISIASDFIGGDGVDHVANNRQFAAGRKLGDNKKEMSRLYSFESNFSITGANADYRFRIKPSEEAKIITGFYKEIVLGLPSDDKRITKASNDLKKSGKNSLILAGANDIDIQILVASINHALGAYETTIDASRPTFTRAGNDKKLYDFIGNLEAGKYDGILFYNCNPVYDHPAGGIIASALSKIKFSLSTSDRNDETASLCKYVAPDNHYLESWNDFNLSLGEYTLSQPTISNLFNSRQAQQSFLNWAGVYINYYEFIRENWREDLMPKTRVSDFNKLWDQSLHDGVLYIDEPALDLTYNDLSGDAHDALEKLKTENTEGLELRIYKNGSVGTGIQANNPWLQEMPDPITKACWDNYITVSPAKAKEWGIDFHKDILPKMETRLIKVSIGGESFKIPFLPQPGQAEGSMGLALGYGRSKAGKVGNNIGFNAYPLLKFDGTNIKYSIRNVKIEPTDEVYQIAQTQTAQTYMGRDFVIQETNLKSYQKDPSAGRHSPKISTSEGFKKAYSVSLWKGHKYANHHWGMAIDLNSCTGCGTCMISCQTENNIPVVGKQEVLNRREMHWLRIDRYYSSNEPEGDYFKDQKILEKASENPEVTFQPMMCQQCNNAPCETVCPVAATTHSSEGLNQMTYNRCIGTRYCANNCPYKVRRFNWFKYHDNEQFGDNLPMNNDLGKMVLNPDVTVRARGVMEKCTFCVQTIQAGKLKARREKRRLIDDDVKVACVKSCPSDAMVFGDMKDPNSKISKALKIASLEKGVEAQEPRAFHVLEELRVMPNVWYLTKVRNKEETKNESHAQHADLPAHG